MDYETYEEELGWELQAGKQEGISLVMHWLESGERLSEFLLQTEGLVLEKTDIESNWHRIAKALGREEETNPKKI